MIGSGLSNPEKELLRLLPRVLRARDYCLYTEGGKNQGRRFTDLWLQGGKALLGHKAPGVVRELKNAAERGLFCSFPHPMEQRFTKALEAIFPGHGFRLFGSESSLCHALDMAGFPAGNACANVCLWRPFEEKVPEMVSDTISDGTIPDFLVPVLPWPLGPAVLVLDRGLDASFPPGDIVSPVLLAPALRSLHDLIAAMKDKKKDRGRPRYPKIDRVFARQKSGGIWRRQGIYLYADCDMETEKYASLFRFFLEGGFLIPPSPLDPLILPGEMSAGEEAKLACLLAKSGAVNP